MHKIFYHKCAAQNYYYLSSTIVNVESYMYLPSPHIILSFKEKLVCTYINLFLKK